MTASEKLRALDAVGADEFYGRLHPALPLIADVVEAAERGLESHRDNQLLPAEDQSLCMCSVCVPNRVALTALNEHLGGVT